MNWDNNNSKEEFESVSIIVGSRCGGFDFYAKQNNQDNMFWLGCSETSDLDIYIDKKNLNIFFPSMENIERNDFAKFKIPNIWHGFEFPFLKNGELYLPEDKTYLSLAIRKKMKLTLKERWSLENTPFDIYNKNKNHISTILFKSIPKLI